MSFTDPAMTRQGSESRFLRALLTSITPHLQPGDVLGLSCLGEVAPSQAMKIEGREFHVRRAGSVLEIRQCMAEAEKCSSHLVLITPLQTPQVGSDVRARLYRQQLLPIGEWDAVKTTYGARQIDPRIQAHRHLAEHLVAIAPVDGLPALAGSVLSADTAWRLLLERSLGIPGPVDELRDIMEWATLGKVSTFVSAPEPLREAAINWLETCLGKTAGTWLRCVARGHASELLPLGLACRVVFHPSSEGDVARKVGAAARLEQYTQVSIEPREGLAWAEVAETILVNLTTGSGDTSPGDNKPFTEARLLHRAEQLLVEFRADEYSWLSDHLPTGFGQRLGRLADELSIGLAGEARLLQAQERILATARDVQRHALARKQGLRAHRVVMAIRLLRWLSDKPGTTSTCSTASELSTRWLLEDSFVDRARIALRGEEANKQLADAYRQLASRASAIREERNALFAHGLEVAGWQPDGFLPIEHVLGEVVVPLARAGRVLVLVLDGLSWPVAHELLEDVGQLGWSERLQENTSEPRPVLAAFPTVTECSRASLLAGRLHRGDSAAERTAFSQHPGLRGVSAVDAPPLLHHRASVETMEPREDGLLADIASTRKVVGVVINAVDDHLARDGQLHLQWNADTIRPLPALLEHAARADRIVILIGDHGHVLETGTQFHTLHPTQEAQAATNGDRWRTPTSGPVAEGEIMVCGDRVLLGQGSIVAPWSEKMRYGPQRWGYHGGVTLQEAICPLVVLARIGKDIPGWREVPRTCPPWWKDGPLLHVPTPRATARKKAPVRTAGDELDMYTSPRAFSVARVNGQVIEFALPVEPTPEERGALEMLVRYGRITERQLSRELATRRAGGIMETLMHKLESEGFKALDKEADGEDGRIFVFRPERLEQQGQ